MTNCGANSAEHGRTNVLFVCTGNSCRSQMAEGWARELLGDLISPHSAGIKAHGLNRVAVSVMAEAGVDISAHRSKTLRQVEHIEFDYVVTVCDNARENCPVFPGDVPIIHWAFDDPPRLAADASSEEEAEGHYKRVRDEIRDFVSTLPDLLNLRRVP